MKLAEALLPRFPGGGVIAVVGAGGKTSALFRLGAGRRALVTSTTHLWDPRLESRPPLALVLRPEMEAPGPGPVPAAGPGLTVLMARQAEPMGKLKGIHPSWIPALRRNWDLILVEADGSRGLPVKAPAGHEPVLPEDPGLVLGVIGLGCLGRPLDAGSVHRPERFAAITGCEPGQAIAWAHLEALVRHPEGLFKGVGGTRALLLNQADRVDPSWRPGALPADLVLLGSLEPAEHVIVVQQGRPK
jgi:probable selenium-dependent hydroxylase accessory protein YqeC